ncbi:MAG TPA: class I SAM-dependent methyltransferase [Bryobacteraceae bacterium]|nr:class I SAM-dependent methyltransferase [Bryobacteraceae bacterium]
MTAKSANLDSALQTRHSHGLDQFCSSLEDRPGMSILDLAGANQGTISFLTNYGHRLYSDDFVHQLDDCFGDGDFYENQTNPLKVGKFLDTALGFPDRIFDGALVWDTLQFLTPSLLEIVVGKLNRVLRPGSSMLAFFHAEERVETIPTYSYRISDHRTISLQSRGRRKPAQFFNNRSLEKLFREFDSVKFFLTRDHLREVIVRR